MKQTLFGLITAVAISASSIVYAADEEFDPWKNGMHNFERSAMFNLHYAFGPNVLFAEDQHMMTVLTCLQANSVPQATTMMLTSEDFWSETVELITFTIDSNETLEFNEFRFTDDALMISIDLSDELHRRLVSQMISGLVMRTVAYDPDNEDTTWDQSLIGFTNSTRDLLSDCGY